MLNFLERAKSMKTFSDQQKGSLLAFVAVMFITPDSLFIRLSNVDTWGFSFLPRNYSIFYSLNRDANYLQIKFF